jgi:uncharacterized protein
VKPFTVRLRFHGDLNLFLRSKASDVVERQLAEKTSIKDVIESCGVPHPEVDLIILDECPVDFDRTVADNVKVEVFSISNRNTFLKQQRLQSAEISKFVADGHLGAMARNLRLLGIDVAYKNDADDRQLLDVMVRESRGLLTRDRRLLMHAIVQHGYYPRSQKADEQAIEVVRRFDLAQSIAPFTRCLRCNRRLEDVDKADIIDKLEPLTKLHYDQFRCCPGCKQIYWSGSHFPKLQRRIDEICSRTRGKA